MDDTATANPGDPAKEENDPVSGNEREKEATKTPSPKPDQDEGASEGNEVAPPLITVSKGTNFNVNLVFF